MYKLAAQKKLRFTTDRGDLPIEQLFDLPLTQLDVVARGIDTELKSVTTASFIETAKPDPRKADLELRLELVKDVIDTKQEANKAELAKAARAVKRRKILDAMATKEDTALTTASMKELQKQLDALDE